MNKISQYLSLGFYLVTLIICHPANAEQCCEEVAALDKRVQRLEDKAVLGDTRKLYFSGQVNRAITWVDDGVSSNIAHVDNDNTVSRFNIEGEASYNQDITFWSRVMVKFTPNTSAFNSPHSAQTTSDAESTVRVRLAEIAIRSKKFGTLSMGHGYMATGVNYPAYLSRADNLFASNSLMGISLFRNKVSGAPDATVIPFPVFSANDGPGNGRRDRIRYQTPKFFGFEFAVAHAYQNRGDIWDLGANYAAKINKWLVSVNAGVVRDASRETTIEDIGTNLRTVKYDIAAFSVGILAPFSFTGLPDTGVTVMFATSKKYYKEIDHKNGYVISGTLAYLDKFTDLGMTIIQGNYSYHNNTAIVASANQIVVGQSILLGIQQNIDAVGSEIYLAYTKQMLDIKRSGQKYHDHNALQLGMRVRF